MKRIICLVSNYINIDTKRNKLLNRRIEFIILLSILSFRTSFAQAPTATCLTTGPASTTGITSQLCDPFINDFSPTVNDRVIQI